MDTRARTRTKGSATESSSARKRSRSTTSTATPPTSSPSPVTDSVTAAPQLVEASTSSKRSRRTRGTSEPNPGSQNTATGKGESSQAKGKESESSRSQSSTPRPSSSGRRQRAAVPARGTAEILPAANVEPPSSAGPSGASMAHNNRGDENEEDDESAAFSRNLAHASSTLHGLLRKLGALDDLMPGASLAHSRLKTILAGLRAEGDDTRQLEALSNLCEMLSIATEESLSTFSVDSFVPLLVGLLNAEHNPEIMLLAARALTHLADVLPSSCVAIVHYGAASCFCERLLTIEYIDLAEQSLQALEKLSQEHPVACLRPGGLMAVLSYLDFFATGVQRVAVTTAANMCRQLPPDVADMVVDCVPILTNLLTYQDSKLVEQACICLSRISESFAKSPERISMLCSHGLIEQAARLVSAESTMPLSGSTYTCMIRLLATCAAGSPDVSLTLLRLGVTKTIRDALSGSALIATTSNSPASMIRSSEQMYEMLNLVNELLPPLPDALTASFGIGIGMNSPVPVMSALASPPVRSSPRRRAGAAGSGPDSTPVRSTPPAVTQPPETPERVAAAEIASAKERALLANPELLQTYGEDLVSLMVQVYGVSTSSTVRFKTLASVAKFLHFASPERLQLDLKDIPISSFLAGLLSGKDSSVSLQGLQMAEVLMSKLPTLFSNFFRKEGVVHAIDQLASMQIPLIPTPTSVAARPTPDSGSRRTSRRDAGRGRANETPSPIATRGGGGTTPGGGVTTPAGTPVAASPATPRNSTLRSQAVLRAQKFKQAHFAELESGSPGGVTEGLAKLQRIAAKLNLKTTPKEEQVKLLKELVSVLANNEGVSTFEFVRSGTASALRAFFTAGVKGKGKGKATADGELQRLRLFWEVVDAAEGCATAPLGALVRKLQDALATMERFPVLLNQGPKSGAAAGSLGSQLAALTQPFKLRLCRDPADRVLRDYSSNIVLIEPLATLSAVEDFLWSRVRRTNAEEDAIAGGATGAEVGSPSVAGGGTSRKGGAPGKAPLAAAPTPPGASKAVASKAVAVPKVGDAKSGAKGKGKLEAGGSGKETLSSSSSSSRSTRSAAAAAAAVEERGKGKSKGPEGSKADSKMEEAHAAMLGLVSGMDHGEEDMDEEEDDVLDMEEMEEEEEEFDYGMDEEDGLEDEEEDDVYGDAALVSEMGRDRVHNVQLEEASPSSAAAASASGSSAAATAAAAAVAPPRFAEGESSKPSRRSGSRGFGSGASAAAVAAAAAAAAVAAGGSEGAAKAAWRSGTAAAAAAAAAAATPRLVFSLEGHPLQAGMTIFQAIQASAAAQESRMEEEETQEEEEEEEEGHVQQRRGRRLWEEVYAVEYRRYEEADAVAAAGMDTAAATALALATSLSDTAEAEETSALNIPAWARPLAPLLSASAAAPCKVPIGDKLEDVLVLLRLMEVLNRLGPRLELLTAPGGGAVAERQVVRVGAGAAAEDFVSSKLSSKLSRQLQDVLTLCSGGLPSWCRELTVTCPFLFPFEARQQYFFCTAFGLSRALQRLQHQQQASSSGDSRLERETRELRVGRLQRQKVRVSRARILDSAVKVMELYCAGKAVLEVEYFGEVGTGLGPTLEFYTLVSHELQKRSHNLWREAEAVAGEAGEGGEGGKSELVTAPAGLFPTPQQPNNSILQEMDCFRLLGRVMAKALQDNRLMDLALSMPFYKLMLGKTLGLYDIRNLDSRLGVTLEEMDNLCQRKRAMQANRGIEAEIEGLTFRGCAIADLCLDFTLPGYPEWELKSGGAATAVTVWNLEEYVDLVVDATVGEGVARQMEAFKGGFQQVFPLMAIRLFGEEELERLICGCGEKWTLESLKDNIKFDHGYTASSLPLQHFLQILVELQHEDQRAFLRFVTGSPRLPPGGLAALSPKFTVVRKHPSNSGGSASPAVSSSPANAESLLAGTTAADNDLPSVMTCANYLKLPPYSCKVIMKERLLYAIHEGSASFDLS